MPDLLNAWDVVQISWSRIQSGRPPIIAFELANYNSKSLQLGGDFELSRGWTWEHIQARGTPPRHPEVWTTCCPWSWTRSAHSSLCRARLALPTTRLARTWCPFRHRMRLCMAGSPPSTRYGSAAYPGQSDVALGSREKWQQPPSLCRLPHWPAALAWPWPSPTSPPRLSQCWRGWTMWRVPADPPIWQGWHYHLVCRSCWLATPPSVTAAQECGCHLDSITQEEQKNRICSELLTASDLDRLYGPSQWRFMDRFFDLPYA